MQQFANQFWSRIIYCIKFEQMYFEVHLTLQHTGSQQERKLTINKKSQRRISEEPLHHPPRQRISMPQSQLVTMGCPTFTPKTVLFLWRSPPHLIQPSLDRPLSSPQMVSSSNQPFFHNSPTGQSNWLSNRLTDGLGNNSFPTTAYSPLYW